MEEIGVWSSEAQGKVLPPLRTSVRLSLWLGTETSLCHSRIIGREPQQDFLDALKTANGQVISDPAIVGLEGSLWWGDDRRWYEYPMRIDDVLEPVPLLAIRYTGAPIRHERRVVPRSNTRIQGMVQTLDGRLCQSAPCWTRDISESACRVVVPIMIEAGARVRVRLALEPGHVFEAEGRVLRMEAAPTEIHGLRGRHAVVCWDYAGQSERETEWLAYCARHRWDM